MQLTLQHEHTNELPPNSSLQSEQSKSTKNINKIPQISYHEPAQSAFFVPPVIQPPTSTYKFFIDGLEEILKLSGNEISQNVCEAIKERKIFCQKRIYQAIVNTSYDFVSAHLKQMKQGLKLEMHNLFENIHNSVEAGIWDGQYEINKQNNQFSTNRKEEQLVSYITQELVKRNIDSLRQELDSVEVSQLFSVSELRQKQQLKSKQAEEFVRKIQSQQARHKENMQKLREERRSLQIKSMQQKQAKEEEKKREHHSAIRNRIDKYNEMKTIQNQNKKKIQSQYMRFISSISSAKKPLYKEIQERFDKKMAEEQKQKFKLMRKLMKQRKPISFQEIKQHMQNYKEILYQNQQFRQEKRELKENEMEIIANQRPYRSKFYSLVVDTSRRNRQINNNSDILHRQMHFADYVRKNFVPKIDEAKQQQIEGLIARITSQKKHSSQSRKYMQEGKKNLEKLHILIGELRAKNKIKESQQIVESVAAPRKYINYLEEVKKSRIEKAGTEVSIDYDKQLVTKGHQEITIQAMIRQSKAKHKDHYLNSSVETMDFETHMKGRSSVENDYVEAARAKMALLKRYKGEVESITPKDQIRQQRYKGEVESITPKDQISQQRYKGEVESITPKDQIWQ